MGLLCRLLTGKFCSQRNLRALSPTETQEFSVSNRVLRPSTIGPNSRAVGFPVITTVLAAAIPKCPLCWLVLMSTLGIGPVIGSQWLRPIMIFLLLLSTGGLFLRARRLSSYGPFIMGLTAAIVMYLCKFILNYDAGVYLSGVTLVIAAVWNVTKRPRDSEVQCQC